MPEKVVVLHVGTHKTGTKSLQSMLAENLRWFAEQGLYYPSAGRVHGWGHHNLAWQLTGDFRFEPADGSLDDLVHELGLHQPQSVFLSSEDFESLYRRAEALEGLRFALEEFGYGVEVVVVLRDPVDYVPSLYEELHKHGLDRTLNDFVNGILANGGIMFRDWDLRVDYKQLVTGFADVFGVEAVHAVRYERNDSVGMVLNAASALLHLPLMPIDGWPRLNVRMSERPNSVSEHVNGAETTSVVEEGNHLNDAQLASIGAAFGGLVDELVRRYPV